MRNLIIDGTECTTISDFADTHGISSASVSGWIKKEVAENDKFGAFDQIGPTLVYAVSELLGLKTKYERKAKPKPVEFDVFKVEQDRNLALCVENAELISENQDLTTMVVDARANLNSLQADYDALVKKFDELTAEKNACGCYPNPADHESDCIFSG